ncbi:DUF2461 domain-containing protein [Parabacteroides sp. 52]|uniref:DUF2461 domain-containing protein n=1 Tax=unclassified Parabacteroides TaxID=2649774 RepID=UPI0013CFC5AC|nr:MULTISPECIES: DUF2461 domain-containing protein [unclassified Parabacteroides]MDH6535455.1 uncharacterized protein (TIGR02453 family) [Parabacteroides sp. PM5-20]NDV56097.1 DUF2461 domain-containing protein [Parabacteroides sp. 52]
MNAEIIQFLRELRENNNRPWFQENKERYEVLRKSFTSVVQELIDKISVFDPEIKGLEAKNCLFRIYRDIRFSPNKLPYKTHFAAYIAKGGRNSEYAGYYFHLEPDNCLLSGGIWMPPSKLLKMLRQDIYDQIDEFTAILEDPSFKKAFPTLEGDVLTRMPVGFPADSPYGHILKHKDFSVISNRPDSFFLQKNWMDKAVEDYKKLQVFNRFLNYTVDTYLGRI